MWGAADSRPKDYLVGGKEGLGVLGEAGAREKVFGEAQLVLGGVAAEGAAVDAAHFRGGVGFVCDGFREGGGAVLDERAIHDEELLERGGGDLALRAVHAGAGEVVEGEDA